MLGRDKYRTALLRNRAGREAKAVCLCGCCSVRCCSALITMLIKSDALFITNGKAHLLQSEAVLAYYDEAVVQCCQQHFRTREQQGNYY